MCLPCSSVQDERGSVGLWGHYALIHFVEQFLKRAFCWFSHPYCVAVGSASVDLTEVIDPYKIVCGAGEAWFNVGQK